MKYDDLVTALKRAAAIQKRWGATLGVVIDDDGDGEAHMYAGDSNCSHAKPYDPSDGHGWTFVDTASVGDGILSPAEAIQMACDLFEKAQSLGSGADV